MSIMNRYLNVAERNDAAKQIATLLSGGKPSKREGFSEYNKIYEFGAEVFGHPAEMVMTSVSGHVMGYEFSSEFKDWQSCGPQNLFEAPITKECLQECQNIKKTLEREIAYCQDLVIWTDCDREGENIGAEIYQICNRVKPNIRVHRAKLFELTEASVSRAIGNLCQIDENISQAVDVRQELDLRIGAAFTRMQTLLLQKVFPQTLATSTITYGSCQFPTLGFVVDRYRAVEEFVPQPFWTMRLNHKIADLTIEFFWKREKMFDKNTCETILRNCQENPTATVELVERKLQIKPRPLPLTTVELVKFSSEKLRISPKEIMNVVEKLYTQGYISYPRTNTNSFAPDTNFVELVKQQCENDVWGTFAQRILKEGGPIPRNGMNSIQVHPPIHPTRYPSNFSDLGKNEQKVYEYIVRHFLACLGKDAIGHEILVHVDIANEKFIAKSLEIQKKHFLDALTCDEWNTKEIYGYQNGDQFQPSKFYLEKCFTTPPQLLTEAELVALMEENGIGTDATYAVHIEKIKEMEYVHLDKDMHLVPEPLGLGLAEGYNTIGWELSLAKPNLRADLENDLKMICEGHKSAEMVKQEQIDKYKALYKTVMKKFVEIERALANRLHEQPQHIKEVKNRKEFKPILKCPKCDNHHMIVRTLFCCTGYPTCKNPILLPVCAESIEVLDECCGICGPDVKKLKIKFKRNPFPGQLNPNVLCIGGCDVEVLATLKIKSDSVRKDVKLEILEIKEENAEDISLSDNATVPKVNSKLDGPSPVGPDHCKLPAKLLVSNTQKNPGRKFYQCQKCKGFIKWLDVWQKENEFKGESSACNTNETAKSERNKSRSTASTSEIVVNNESVKNKKRKDKGNEK